MGWCCLMGLVCPHKLLAGLVLALKSVPGLLTVGCLSESISVCLLGVLVPTVILLMILKPKIKPENLDGCHALITGGSSGIGLAVAQRLLTLYPAVHVTLVARNEHRLNLAKDKLVKALPEAASRIYVIDADVSHVESIEYAVQRASVVAGKPVTLLVCSAGISVHKVIDDMSSQEFKDLMDINVNGAYNSVKAVLPGMKEAKKGHICLVSSQAGNIGIIGYSAYSSSKFALRGLAEVLQMELRPFNILVTLTHPPDTDTPSLTRENQQRSQLLREIAETSGVWNPDLVAAGIVHDVSRGKFVSYFGLVGFFLAKATAGAAPVHSLLEFLSDCLLAGVARFLVFFFHVDFDRKIRRAAAAAAAPK